MGDVSHMVLCLSAEEELGTQKDERTKSLQLPALLLLV